MTNIFAVSDIHGQYDQLIKILSHWNIDDELIIMGDLIDRGDNSLKVVQEVMELKKKYPDKVTLLKGNHEDMFLNFLDEPFEYGELFFINGGNTTAYEFGNDEFLMFKSFKERAEIIKQRRPEEIEFIRNLDYHYEFGDILFVHAGVDPFISDWRKTEPHKFLWNRGGWNHRNETGKIIVFGHTPTQTVHKDKSNDIWISRCKTYINIDGGAVFKGQLNGVLMNDKGEILQTYIVK